MSEKINFAKFQKLQNRGMHTVPSLLPGDIRSGVDTLVTNDFEPLGKFESADVIVIVLQCNAMPKLFYHHFANVFPLRYDSSKEV
jgi:hypothetical protein